MQALVYVGGEKGVELRECAVPQISEGGQVLVRVRGAGISGNIITGNYPPPLGRILGHEMAGVVHDTGQLKLSLMTHRQIYSLKNILRNLPEFYLYLLKRNGKVNKVEHTLNYFASLKTYTKVH